MSETSEIRTRLQEIEDDANDAGGMTIDQRLHAAGIMASLLATDANHSSRAVMRRQARAAERAVSFMQIAGAQFEAPAAIPPEVDAAVISDSVSEAGQHTSEGDVA